MIGKTTVVRGVMLFLSLGLVLCAVGCPLRNFTHRVSIERHYSTQAEADLIRIAEDAYPEGADPEAAPEDVWWYELGFPGGMRYPYAITTEAIAYYAEMVEREDQRPALIKELTYSADIAYHDAYSGEDRQSFSGVYVVTMEFSYYRFAGSLAILDVSQDRTVVLSPDGTVLRIYGDGPAHVVMS